MKHSVEKKTGDVNVTVRESKVERHHFSSLAQQESRSFLRSQFSVSPLFYDSPTRVWRESRSKVGDRSVSRFGVALLRHVISGKVFFEKFLSRCILHDFRGSYLK